MKQRRIERLNQLLREEMSDLVRSELKDPRIGSVTITRVDVTPDLMHATVRVRTLTAERPIADAIAGLESAEGFIRRRLGRELRLRRIPELHFEADRSLEHAQRVDILLEEALGSRGEEDGED